MCAGCWQLLGIQKIVWKNMETHHECRYLSTKYFHEQEFCHTFVYWNEHWVILCYCIARQNFVSLVMFKGHLMLLGQWFGCCTAGQTHEFCIASQWVAMKLDHLNTSIGVFWRGGCFSGKGLGKPLVRSSAHMPSNNLWVAGLQGTTWNFWRFIIDFLTFSHQPLLLDLKA